MEEKTIIEGQIKEPIFLKWVLKIGIILFAVGIAIFMISVMFGCYLNVGWIFGVGFSCVFTERIYYVIMHNCSITVTDQRVIGKANFGKRVDLPLNKISAISQQGRYVVSVATSSGKINFGWVDNRDDVFNALGELIKDYQIKKVDFSTGEARTQQPTSQAEEILKYKQLLDAGAITQEEFDAKKKQLLGL